MDVANGDVIDYVADQDATEVTTDFGRAYLTPDVRFISALDEDLRYKVWNVADHRIVYTAEEGWVIVSLSDDASLAVIRNDEVGTRLVDTATGNVRGALLAAVDGLVPVAAFSPDNRYVVVLNIDLANFLVFDTVEVAKVAEFGGETENRKGFSLQFTPSGGQLVVAGFAGNIMVYDFAAIVAGSDTEKALLRSIQVDEQGLPSLTLSPDGSMVGVGLRGGGSSVFELETGRRLADFESDIELAVAFHRTKPWVYVSQGDVMTIHTLDLDELREIARERLTREMTDDECERYLRAVCDR